MLKIGDEIVVDNDDALSGYQDVFKIVSVIGEGAYGKVFKADVSWGMSLAVKELDLSKISPDQHQETKEMFKREIEILKDLQSVYFPKFIGFLPENQKYAFLRHAKERLGNDEPYCLVMEYVDGENLNDYLQKNGPLPEERVQKIGLELLNALKVLDERGILYRDLKPQNIILTGETKIKIVDMGTAKDIKISSGDNTKIGTPGFAAPEQYCRDGMADVRTDIYNFGATLINLLGGKVDAFYLNKLNLPNVSMGFVKFLQKAVEPKPQDRYQTIAETRKTLEKVKIDKPKPQKQAVVNPIPPLNPIKIWNGWNCKHSHSKHVSVENFLMLIIIGMFSFFVIALSSILICINNQYYISIMVFKVSCASGMFFCVLGVILYLSYSNIINSKKDCLVCFSLNCFFVPINLFRLLWQKIKTFQIGSKIRQFGGNVISCLKKIKVGNWDDAKSFICGPWPPIIGLVILFFSWLLEKDFCYLQARHQAWIWVFILAFLSIILFKSRARHWICGLFVFLVAGSCFILFMAVVDASIPPFKINTKAPIEIFYKSPIKINEKMEIEWRTKLGTGYKIYLILPQGEKVELKSVQQKGIRNGCFSVILTKPTTLKFFIQWEGSSVEEFPQLELFRLIPVNSEILLDNKPIKF